jgi:pilus assembly protein CpaF
MHDQETIDLLGPLGPLYADDTVSEIMVDGHDRVYVERQGVLEDVPSPFADSAALIALVTALTTAAGRPASEAQPVVDFRLPDGSRTNAVLPPIALTGPTLVIRKFPARQLTIEDLLGFGSWSEPMAAFLRACVQARLNMVITGGTGSGKTTVLNLIAGMAPAEERLVVVENATELRLPQRRVVRLESRPPDTEGRGAVSLRQLVVNATHMRPDRIVLGEATGPEALDMIQAMNNGHDGSLFSLHATSPRDALTRLETLGLMAAPELPLLTLRQQIASAVHLITYQEHMPDKRRRMTKIAEVTGFEGQAITLQDIFEFRQTGFQNGQVTGTYTATGHLPRVLGRLRDAGVDLPLEIFNLA